MKTNSKRSKPVLLLFILCFSAVSVGLGAMVLVRGEGPTTVPEGSGSYNALADEDSIVDPTGQSVKQSETLELGRSVVLDVVQPIDWNLEVFDMDVVSAQVPMDLDLELGLTFPINVETSYDPYAVHNGTSFPFVIDINNNGCTPSFDVGVDFEMDFSDLNFDFAGCGNLLEFATEWDSIVYSEDFSVPFYGVETKMGNWLSYDILDRYYSLEDILGLSLDWDKFAIRGGVGVNIQYNLYSYVTATADIESDYGSTSQDLTWNNFGAKTVGVNVDEDALHGDVYSIQVGDWVYHIAHDVTFSVWADIGLEVLSLDIIDETFDYAYTLDMGELTFPERNDFTFESYAEVLAGTNVQGTTASWTAIGFDYGPNGGDFEAFDYEVEIPENEKLQEWFSDMNVDFALGADIAIDFPFNMMSYYNARKVTPGSTFDYNLLMDSVGAASPSINYGVDLMLDLSNVEIFGYSLDKYEKEINGELFSVKGLGTPFGTDFVEEDITSIIQLDTLSGLLNEYIADLAYGINPDIQFNAYIVLQLDAYMTGTVSLTDGASVVEATEFVWDEQFDTQTTRIEVPASLNPGDSFDVQYTDLTYHLEVTPGIKLAASALGGVVAFDYTFMIPGVSEYLQKTFEAPDFIETVEVNQLGFDADNMEVSDPIVEDGDNTVSGTFDLTGLNDGTTDHYIISLIDDDLPAGSSAVCQFGSMPCDTNALPMVGILGNDETVSVAWELTLGPNAHDEEYMMDNLKFEIVSFTDDSLFATVEADLDIRAEAGLVTATVVMEEELEVTPGIGVVIPVPIKNDGLVSVDYTVIVAGDNVAAVESGVKGLCASGSATSVISLAPGASTVFEYGIDVDAISSSAAGDYDVSVSVAATGMDTITKELTYTVPQFTVVDLTLVSADEEVEAGDDATYYFELSNNGNTEANVNVSVEGIETIGGLKELTLGPGSSPSGCFIQFDSEDLTPGLNTFNLIVEEYSEVLYDQEFTINVKQLSCVISSEGNEFEYTDSALHYSIRITNEGSDTDTIDVSIAGLDASAYTLEPAVDKVVFAGSEITLDLTIDPSDLSKVRGGVNFIAVQVDSDTFGYSEYVGGSAVEMPEAYDILAEDLETEEDGNFYYMTFTVENDGNMADILDIQVDSDADYEIICSNLVDGSDSEIALDRGEEVEVTVKFSKSTEGKFKPTVSVVSSEDETLSTMEGNFWVGTLYSPTVMIIAIVSAVLVSAGVVLLGLYSRGIIMPSSGRTSGKLNSFGSSISNKMSDMKSNMSQKISGIKESRQLKKINAEFSVDEKKIKTNAPKETSETPAKPDYWNLSDE